MLKEVQIKMAVGLEEIDLKILTQLKLLELAEKGTEGLITRNKKSEIEKQLGHTQPKLEKNLNS